MPIFRPIIRSHVRYLVAIIEFAISKGKRWSPGYWAIQVALSSLILSSCVVEKPKLAGQSHVPSVIAVKAESKAVEKQDQFVGRVVATAKVELRARVSGFLKSRGFTEGQRVAVGNELFVIEPDQYQAVVEQRKADVAKAKADEENARAQYHRGKELLKSKSIARAKVDELRAAESIATASIAQAEASLAVAELDLGYTRITAPIAGRIGLAEFSVGNLVGPSSGPLATIVSHGPIYVEFPVTQRQLLTAKHAIKQKGGNLADMVARARLPDDSLYTQAGSLNFVDVTTNPGTDTVIVRAAFPNPDGVLVDEQYVGVLVEAGEAEQSILIPQSALQVDQQGIYIMIIDQDSKAQIRRIETGTEQGADIQVTKGLKEGELVISQGVQKVRPGLEVTAAPAPTAKGSVGS